MVRRAKIRKESKVVNQHSVRKGTDKVFRMSLIFVRVWEHQALGTNRTQSSKNHEEPNCVCCAGKKPQTSRNLFLETNEFDAENELAISDTVLWVQDMNIRLPRWNTLIIEEEQGDLGCLLHMLEEPNLERGGASWKGGVWCENMSIRTRRCFEKCWFSNSIGAMNFAFPWRIQRIVCVCVHFAEQMGPRLGDTVSEPQRTITASLFDLTWSASFFFFFSEMWCKQWWQQFLCCALKWQFGCISMTPSCMWVHNKKLVQQTKDVFETLNSGAWQGEARFITDYK